MDQEYDAVILDQGVAPDNTLFDALKDRARNGGKLDLDALAEGRPQPEGANGDFMLHRIGDALMSRDAHAAIYEARRLCQTI